MILNCKKIYLKKNQYQNYIRKDKNFFVMQ